jgi:hypothetical protein
MFSEIARYRLLAFAASVVLIQYVTPFANAAAPSGSYIAVLNEQRNFSDSMNSITFFDTSAPSTPLFSVYVGREPVGSNEWEEPGALAVNPATGDVYVLCFDSGSASSVGTNDPAGDVQGDYDLLKINFAAAYNHWSTNLQGHNLQGESLVTGPAPAGVNNSLNLDYVTYASSAGEFNAFHANQFALPGVVEKIGQVARNYVGGNDFFDYSLDFVDESHLLVLEDSITASATDNALDDHSIRLLTRVSTSPGAATATTVTRTDGGTNYLNGGYAGANLNASFPQASTQSWESKIVEHAGGGTGDPFLLNLDLVGHSEPESIAYYQDPVSGVRGVWITEADMPATGDAVAFMQLDANNETVGYRQVIGTSNPNYLTLSNDPAAGSDLKGQADNVFIDKDTGDLIIVESGFNDDVNGVGPAHEPGVLRVAVNYDSAGQIEFGTWQPKLILSPTKDTGDTTLERGAWSSYDSVNNIVYFFNPGASGETPPNEMDIYALDLDTGVTTSYMNVDDSVALFLGDSFGDKTVAFTLSASLPGDYNGDGKVDAADYVIWRNDPAGHGGNPAGYNAWRTNFGASAGSGVGAGAAVPEPASLCLLMFGLLGAWLGVGRKRG